MFEKFGVFCTTKISFVATEAEKMRRGVLFGLRATARRGFAQGFARTVTRRRYLHHSIRVLQSCQPVRYIPTEYGDDITNRLLRAKIDRKITFEELSKKLDKDEVWVAALLHRQAATSEDEAAKVLKILGLADAADHKELILGLTRKPERGTHVDVTPQDPLMYRLHEIMTVYGPSLKAVINEKFGDGILSAIDFTTQLERKNDPKGDRIVIKLDGKFLPYRKSW
eukprot:TRINITY_DN7756_c0_g1_i1.p1 TRINITY_DN7756_c0_g1~~TRINITY_DN7756_c0_g1_i1.p1  ORF type:complete len:225 (-),score=26.41 TRINITY_DN7756_c0_g1_i1:44-718(-)